MIKKVVNVSLYKPQFSVEVSPVSVTDICTVTFSEYVSDVTISVLSIDGFTPEEVPYVLNITFGELANSVGDLSADLYLSTLPVGTYFVEVTTNDYTVIKKITKE